MRLRFYVFFLLKTCTQESLENLAEHADYSSDQNPSPVTNIDSNFAPPTATPSITTPGKQGFTEKFDRTETLFAFLDVSGHVGRLRQWAQVVTNRLCGAGQAGVRGGRRLSGKAGQGGPGHQPHSVDSGIGSPRSIPLYSPNPPITPKTTGTSPAVTLAENSPEK